MDVDENSWRDIGVSWDAPNNPQIRLRGVDADFTAADLFDPKTNIEVGVFLLAELSKRIDQPTVQKIATLYHNLRETGVSGYGWTVGIYLRDKPWEHQSP